MSEAKLHPSRNTFSDDSALDTAAEALTGLTVSRAADLAWTSLTALAVGDRYDMVIHHRAIVLLALQVKPLRDWLLVRAVNYEDLSLACTRELVWFVAKAPQALQASSGRHHRPDQDSKESVSAAAGSHVRSAQAPTRGARASGRPLDQRPGRAPAVPGISLPVEEDHSSRCLGLGADRPRPQALLRLEAHSSGS